MEVKKAIELLEKALAIDPGYTAAHGLAAWCYATLSTIKPDDLRRSKGLYHARAVLGPETDDSLALAFAAFALALLERDYDVVLDAISRTLMITPGSSIVLHFSAIVSAFAGYFGTAIFHTEDSLRLNPFDPMRF